MIYEREIMEEKAPGSSQFLQQWVTFKEFFTHRGLFKRLWICSTFMVFNQWVCLLFCNIQRINLMQICRLVSTRFFTTPPASSATSALTATPPLFLPPVSLASCSGSPPL